MTAAMEGGKPSYLPGESLPMEQRVNNVLSYCSNRGIEPPGWVVKFIAENPDFAQPEKAGPPVENKSLLER